MAETTKEYGLIGYPLGHSFSQQFFSEKFEAEKIDARYLNFELEKIDDLPELIASHPALLGFNVTIPYKQSVIALLDQLSAEAEQIGAVNTVKVTQSDDGKVILKGYNTDIIGFRESLRPFLKPGEDCRALVLGSGGAAKAISAGLRQLGIEPTTVSRNPDSDGLRYTDLTDEIMATHTVVVNATPLGMWPDTASCPPIPYNLLTARHVCFDAVYNPCPTLFMQLAAERRATVVGGLEMLHIQALSAWQIWND